MRFIGTQALSLIITLLAGCSSATPEPALTPSRPPLSEVSQIEFDFGLTAPAIANGEREHWTGKWLNPGGVVHHEGMFHMFLNAFHNWPGVISIGHFVSEDGVTWEAAQDEPLFTSEDIPYLTKSQGADVSSALVLPDGTWALYFHPISGINGAGIGMATALSPEGPWTFSEGPVLTPGDSGEWDEYQLRWPNVAAGDDGYVMYYTGANLRNSLAIGMATSDDGYLWTKYNDPATSEDGRTQSDPVIVGEGGWEGQAAERPRALLTPDGWIMFYTGSTLNSRGLAFSNDGVHWEQFTRNPVITADEFQHWGNNTWDTNLTYLDGVYYYYMEVGSLANTQIFLATFEAGIE